MIRPAGPDDVTEILAMIRELARYERAADAVEADEFALRTALFGDDPRVFAAVAEEDGSPVGFAMWFLTFSTWTGRHGIYLEDLFVRPAHRGSGHGRALLAGLARLAVERGYRRVEWSVLDWNTPAGDFYRSLGAVPKEEWTGWRVDGAALPALAVLSDGAAGADGAVVTSPGSPVRNAR